MSSRSSGVTKVRDKCSDNSRVILFSLRRASARASSERLSSDAFNISERLRMLVRASSALPSMSRKNLSSLPRSFCRENIARYYSHKPAQSARTFCTPEIHLWTAPQRHFLGVLRKRLDPQAMLYRNDRCFDGGHQFRPFRLRLFNHLQKVGSRLYASKTFFDLFRLKRLLRRHRFVHFVECLLKRIHDKIFRQVHSSGQFRRGIHPRLFSPCHLVRLRRPIPRDQHEPV